MKVMVNDKFPLNAALVKVVIICVLLGNVALAVTVMSVIWIIDPLLMKGKKQQHSNMKH